MHIEELRRGLLMVKLVTVLEKQMCKACKGKGKTSSNSKCAICGGSGTVEVEVLR